MYHIVICDDEPIFLTQISEMIIDILASMGESCEIRKYTSISELKNTLQNTPKSCDMLILDEVLGAVEFGIISDDDVVNLIQAKDEEMEMILTGNVVTPKLKEAADRVVSLEIIK